MLNYIGVFLTFKCNLGCDYCLNRQGSFKPREEITTDEWIKILEDVHTREDLPISLQGGEPTLYPGFFELVKRLHARGHRLDLLTNGYFDVFPFMTQIKPEMFRRDSPYASIRFSYHATTDAEKLLDTVYMLQQHDYSVGIWGIQHPSMKEANARMAGRCKRLGIDYREKEFLDSTHGTYKYPGAVKGERKPLVRCTPSELLFAPDGELFSCHHLLYSGDNSMRRIKGVVMCTEYGNCNPCDIKLKTNRLQQGGHCSVEIHDACRYCGEDPSTCFCEGD